MATSRKDAMLSNASAFACAMCHRVGLQMPPPGDADQVLVASCPPGAESTNLIDIHDISSPPSYAASSSDRDWNDVTKGRDAPTFGLARLKAGFVLLYQLVTALVVQVTVIASDVVSLKDRITAVEGTQTPALVHGQGTEALTRQVSELCERVVSQEDRIAGLELSQRAETDSYKKTIQGLTTKLDDMKVDGDKKGCDDALENLCQSFKNFQQSMECQAARITGVRADTARKVALLQSELADVQAELAAVKTVVVPVKASSTSQTAKECRKARISVTRRIEDAGMGEENLCPLPSVVARGSACVTVFQDTSAALTSSGGSSNTLSNYRKTEETTVKNLEITKEPLTTAHAIVAQPGADKIPAIPMIPVPTIPMERLIPVKVNGKESKPCNSSTTTLQYTKTSQPGAGRSPDVGDKPPTVSPKKAQPGAGLPSRVSALPKPRKSMLPAPRKSHLPSLAKHAAVVDDDSSNEVKSGGRLPGGSETQTERPKTFKVAPIATSRPPLKSALSTLAEKERPPALPASSSLAALDAALQAMQVDGGDLLTLVSAPNSSNDDLSFSVIAPISMKTKRNDRYESIYVSPKQRSADVKPPRSPLKSILATPAKNDVSLTALSSLAALDAAIQMLQGEGDILTLMPGPDYRSVDLSFSAVTPVLIKARPHCKRESIYVSPKKAAVKPSRRL